MHNKILHGLKVKYLLTNKTQNSLHDQNWYSYNIKNMLIKKILKICLNFYCYLLNYFCITEELDVKLVYIYFFMIFLILKNK